MQRISLVLVLALCCGGCSTYSPRYTPDPRADSSLEPLHLAVAVPFVDVGRQKIDAGSMTGLLVQDLRAARLFDRQQAVPAKYRPCDAAGLSELHSQGYDAVLVVNVSRLLAGPNWGTKSTALLGVGVEAGAVVPAVGLGTLAVAGAAYSVPQGRNGSMAIEYRLVEAPSGNLMSLGPVLGAANVKSGEDRDAKDQAVKATFAKLIQNIRDAQLPDTPGTASPQQLK